MKAQEIVVSVKQDLNDSLNSANWKLSGISIKVLVKMLGNIVIEIYVTTFIKWVWDIHLNWERAREREMRFAPKYLLKQQLKQSLKISWRIKR